MSRLIFFLIFSFCFFNSTYGQLSWKNVDSLYQPLPRSAHIYFTDNSLDNAPFRAFYLITDLKDKNLVFTVDTSKGRRLTPKSFYERNNKALAIVNTTFFSFESNKNLNVVIKDGKLIGYNQHTIAGKGKDTLTYRHVLGSAIGISKDRVGDVAWVFTDSDNNTWQAFQVPISPIRDSSRVLNKKTIQEKISPKTPALKGRVRDFFDWKKIKTAIGGGPVLIQGGEIKITNEEELKFAGKAINDKHPRTAMGYTRDNKLIILVIEGRNPKAAGATLIQEAQILKELGCWEALNLDGGGSSCLLVNGKETIKPSDLTGQRPVPAVFVIK